MNDTAETAKWSLRYQTALRKQLEQRHGPSQRLVQSLGRQAVALGLETLDLAKTHAQALSTLISPSDTSKTRERTIRRARKFFAEAAVRIEKTHRAALETDLLIHQLNKTLQRRTRETAASKLRLKRTILQRRGAEEALKRSGEHHTKLLAESHCLLKHLRNMTHACLLAQEDDRKSVSRQLHDEIAQGLLGLHVRFLTFKKAMKASRESLKKEIGNTQRLVTESTKKVNRFAHEYGRSIKA
jgi:signal transduction histidine kinase